MEKVISTHICAVVVTYNRLNKLKTTLANYLLAGIDQLIIVNNASTDGTEAFLESFKPDSCKTHILTQTKNSGGAGGFNIGLKYAQSLTNIDWIVVSDDDSYPSLDALSLFKSSIPSTIEHSILASAVYYPDGNICPMNQPMQVQNLITSLIRVFSGKKITGIDTKYYSKNDTIPIIAASFVGLFIRFNALVESKILPDPSFFLYWDDISFCLDMKKKGYDTSFYPSIKYFHDCPRHSKTLTGKPLYFMTRNGIRTIKRLPITIAFFALPFKILHWLLQSIKTKSFTWFLKALRDL